MSINVVLADDHPLVLEGLGSLLSREKDFAVVANCCTGRETVEAVRDHRPDILVLDLRMPGGGGLEVLSQLKREDLHTQVVVLTAGLDEEEVLEALRSGVGGVILKETAPKLLIECLRKVHAGQRWADQECMGRLFELVLRRESNADALSTLTSREQEIVSLVLKGLRPKQIAHHLIVSEGTIKVHLHNIYEKLGVDGRTGLVLWARNWGLS